MNSRGDKLYENNLPLVLLLCDSEIIINSLIKIFKSSGFLLVVVTENKKILNKDIQNYNKLLFIKNLNIFEKYFSTINYLIQFNRINKKSFENNSLFLENLRKEIRIFSYINKKYKPKSTFVLYGLRERLLSEHHLHKYKNYAGKIKSCGVLVTYTDLVSEEAENYFLSELQQVLLKAASNKKIKLVNNQNYYPILVDEFAAKLVHLLFSLKAYGKSVLISGRPIKAEILKILDDKKLIKFNKNRKQRKTLPYEEEIFSRKKSKLVIDKAYEQLKNKRPSDNSRTSKLKISIIDYFRYPINLLTSRMWGWLLRYKYKITIAIILYLFIQPLLLIIISLSFLYTSGWLFNSNLLEASIKLADTSTKLSKFNNNFSSNVRKMPVVGNYFSLFIKPSFVLQLQGESLVKGLELVDVFSDIFKNIYSNDDLDIERFSQNIIFDLEIIYQKLGFLETEISDNKNFGIGFVSKPIENFDLSLIRKDILLIKNISSRLPTLLGSDKVNSYALVFQNNLKLRPTGGSIETFSIINISGSKITSEVVGDVSMVDRNIVGRIDPPEIIQKYFGMDRWYFKDSNWDPDFPTTAGQLNSFINKGLDVSPQGVVGLDRKFLFKFLEAIDNKYNVENLDNLLGQEVERDNYPVNVDNNPLTNLLTGILSNKPEINKRKSLEVIKEIYSGLNDRSVQVFIKDEEAQKSISALSWDGSFFVNSCEKPCYYDFMSLIESTQEGDNERVLRESQISVSFHEGIIKRRLDFYIENNNDKNYKAYLRLFTNADVGFSPVSLINEEGLVIVDPDVRSARGFKEAGVFIEIKPKNTLAVTFAWEGVGLGDFKENNEYRLFWRRQAGVEKYPFEVLLSLPQSMTIVTEPQYSLTEQGLFRYNTSLDRDFLTSVYWK